MDAFDRITNSIKKNPNRGFEVGDKIILSLRCDEWKDSSQIPFRRAENLKKGIEYTINSTVYDGREEWVSIKEGNLLYPAWCYDIAVRSNSGKKNKNPQFVDTGIPGLKMLKFDE